MNRGFYGKIVLTGRIKAVTGLHIGSQREVSEIGGIDNPVIKDPVTGLPYIPGSSLKGRLRSLFELYVNSKLDELKKKYNTLSKYSPGSCRGKGENCNGFFNRQIHNGWIHVCSSYNDAIRCPVCRLFGASGKDSNFPSRLIVRDAFLVDEWVEKWKAGEDITEAKIEVGIDRVTSQANPRTNERVVAGAEFGFEIIYNVEDPTQWEDDMKNLLTAMALLEDSYLGGSGSRGYGKVEFTFESIEYRPPEYYRTGDKNKIVHISEGKKRVTELLSRFEDEFEKKIKDKMGAGKGENPEGEGG